MSRGGGDEGKREEGQGPNYNSRVGIMQSVRSDLCRYCGLTQAGDNLPFIK